MLLQEENRQIFKVTVIKTVLHNTSSLSEANMSSVVVICSRNVITCCHITINCKVNAFHCSACSVTFSCILCFISTACLFICKQKERCRLFPSHPWKSRKLRQHTTCSKNDNPPNYLFCHFLCNSLEFWHKIAHIHCLFIHTFHNLSLTTAKLLYL